MVELREQDELKVYIIVLLFGGNHAQLNFF